MGLKIGLVVNSAWNIYNFRRDLIQYLMSEGYEIVAIAPNDGYGEHLKRMGCVYEEVKMQPKSSNPIYDLIFTKNLFQIYKKHQLRAVLHFTIKPNIYGTLAARWAGIPSINNVTGLGTVFLHDDLKSKIAKFLYKFAFRFPAKIFFQNDDDLSLFLSLKLVRREKTEIIPGSGVNLDTFSPQDEFKRQSPFVFLMIARLLYDKGIVEFVEAAKILKNKSLNAVFKVLGGIETTAGLGVSKMQVNEWVKHGWIEHFDKVEDVRPFIQKADVVVLPSYREGTPRSLLEAASMEKPLIATNVAGCKEVVKHQFNGFLCEVRNANDLAQKMQEIYELHEEKLKQMGKNSRIFMAEKFDQKLVFQKYNNALKNVL
ncbi:MAG: glycosyltransferase family 4 protein [Flammeovirgaceae bacterium]